jgi:ATPase subunit of ABC transporter with duplicated ATPase domains
VSRIILNSISWNRPDGSNLFKNITTAFNKERTGLAGSNGTGKTTIARIICGVLSPSSGSVIAEGNIKYIPQDISLFNSMTVGEVISGKKKYSAYRNILSGNGTTEDLDNLNDDWEIENKIIKALSSAGINYFEPYRLYSSLSGGEKVKCILASLFIEETDFAIMDEPTNHLDGLGRNIVYEFVSNWQNGLIVISHDRTLLRLMDSIMELSSLGLKSYGGNYDFYIEQKGIEKTAALTAFRNAESQLKKSISEKNNSIAKQEKRSRVAEKNNAKGNIPKIMINKLRGAGEQTLKKVKEVHEKRIDENRERLDAVKNRLSENRQIRVDISCKNNPESKTIVRIEELNYSYLEEAMLWNQALDLTIRGGDRIVLKGKNGSGKTTLLKMITGELLPTKGKIYVGTNKISFIDQHVSIINNELTLLDNLKLVTDGKLPAHELRIRLGRFLFYKDDVFKKGEVLSGGERIRAGLACMLAREETPELIMMDEPTNNLDLESIEEVIGAFNNYKGALIVISHDADFINDIGIDKEIDLDAFCM